MLRKFCLAITTLAFAYFVGYCVFVPMFFVAYDNTAGAHGEAPTVCHPSITTRTTSTNNVVETSRDVHLVCDYRSAGSPWVSRGYFSGDDFVQIETIDAAYHLTTADVFHCIVKFHDFGLPYRIFRVEDWDALAGIWDCHLDR